MDSWISWAGLFWVAAFAMVAGISTIIIAMHALAKSQNSQVPKWRPKNSPIHLLVVLGSGGHTAEMFSMLRRMKLDPSKYTYRTYLVSSGDNFSAAKAVEFETAYINKVAKASAAAAAADAEKKDEQRSTGAYTIVTVPRARRVHQSFLTAPFSTIQSFWSCLLVLRGLHPDQRPLTAPIRSPYPDIILTNGPATAVCVILAARLLRLCHAFCAVLTFRRRAGTQTGSETNAPDFQLRTIFVESWARVTTLSLSGKLLLPFADRFLVQWPALEGKKAWPGMRETEYAGTLVD
ncbi:UDP-N-acetylglucosamine transferase subunit alg14 [Aspergillus heteromorphus CBS 117.55]|uniref:UDP-N-acetylglucosamine transferase subunit ALG14 n=1 Tax=Aspergillus heteromorphus CBS 117.55 TaxID=1448321 RepID=A0A317VT79_9EURO|nr:UDP-N-acetylglucosamine transferase subunit alg14 [Aspergillus heteromorphus CBS 117.55]PWY76227.1 UDP-N-acetylglucosamine transferase subunit alg14 [Aspergillus heteromorphus CBS 117.55]